MKIFDVEAFNPLEFIQKYEGLCKSISPLKKSQPFFNGRYAIVPMAWNNSVNHYKVLDIPHFANHQLIALKSEKFEGRPSVIFTKNFLQLMRSVIKNLFDVIIQHLSQRVIHGVKLTQYEHLRQLMAEVITDCEMAKLIFSESYMVQSMAYDSLESALLKLMKLPGGRAFLKGSVVDLLFTLRAFKNVYAIT